MGLGRKVAAGLLAAALLSSAPAFGQKEDIPYKIEFDFNPKEDQFYVYEGKSGVFLRVRFTVTALPGAPADPGKEYKILIKERDTANNWHIVKEVDVPRPKATDELSVVLALDISGSMSEHGRMAQARRAGGVFFKSLPTRADCGLVLFNHQVQASVPPPGDREKMRQQVESAQPSGGTAYLDSALRAIDMLRPFANKSKAVVLMTDGVDINSDATLEKVVAQARKDQVRIYTVGIGEPGRQEKVTSVLVLDKSGSMNLRANDKDPISKIEALKNAADKFVNSIGSARRSAILEFSDDAEVPAAFTNDKFELKRKIKQIHAKGETALLDAVYAAVATLEAENPAGKKAVVALTDGIDNRSRRRVDEVIARALDAKVPLYLLGFGRQGELDVKTMEAMADQTKGKFYYAENDQALMKHFENLSVQLHDDGIDEVSLRRLADETEGKYYAAKNVDKLEFILEQVTKTIQGDKHSITFPSLNQRTDGLPRHVSLELAKGKKTVFKKEATTQTPGLVIAEMAPLPYLILLVGLALLIVLPGILRSKARSSAI